MERGRNLYNPTCLFIAPLKGDDTATRERSEDVYASLVNQAAIQAGYVSDFILDGGPGTILMDIVRRIQACRVLIADATGNNFSVGYELGFAHMIGKPTILLIKSGSILPYDIRDMRAVSYDYTNRGTLRKAIPDLVAQLHIVKKSPPWIMDNPLKNTLRALEPPKLAQAPPPVAPIQPPPKNNPLASIMPPPGPLPSIFAPQLMPQPEESLITKLTRMANEGKLKL